MKFSTITTLGGFLGVVSAGSHIQEVVCTDPAPTTIYQTVTVTAGVGAGGNGNGNGNGNATPYVATNGGEVTSVNYDGTKTSVWVYPTGSQSSKDCTVAIYEVDVIVTVVVININITTVNGQTTTVTETKTDIPSSTPALPPTTSSSSLPTTNGTIHKVIVGADGQLKYKDNQVNAAIGDIIRFDFNSTNHTVTQSSFNDPCVKLPGGFDTGFHQFNNKSETGIIFRDFKVTVSTPLWFYCAQKAPKSHCQAGMVLGVNPAGKFAAFLDKATNTASIPHSTGGIARHTTSASRTAPATKSASSARSSGTGKPMSPKERRFQA